MHSMTAATAADTTAPPDPATQEGGWVADTFIAVFDWIVDVVPGGLLTLICAGIAIHLMAGGKKATSSTDWKNADQAVLGVAKGLWGGLRSLAKTLWAILRFLGGYELRGEPRSTATFVRSGIPTDRPDKAPASAMGSVAALDPRVSLIKPRRRQPSRWARRLGTWLTGYRGRGARALDRTITAALWAARITGKVWRGLTAVWAVLAGVYGVVAPIVTTIARALRAWHCWPYAARGLARITLIATVVGLAVPAWRTLTTAALAVVLAAVVLLAHRHRPKPPGDDQVYGPRLWVILREDLRLPEDEPRENWLHLPAALTDPAARIVLRLPAYVRGSEIERAQITDLINSRLPGEWVARFSFTGEHPKVVYTHKPPPKPKAPDPEPPGAVDLFGQRIQNAIDAAQEKPETYVFGVDEHDEIVEIPLVGEQAHIAVSVGTGGGKSALLQMLATQVVRRRGTILGVDPKMVSLKPLKGIDGIYLYDDPGQGGDMRRALEWAAAVVEARFYEYLTGVRKEFPPLFVYMEESNELTGILKAVWMRIKDSSDPNQDPIWETVASILRKGRQVNVHVVAVFQDLKDTDFSGVSLGLLFPVKIMGAYVKKQWDRIVGSNVAMPASERKAGRLVGVKNGTAFRFQSPYVIVDDPNLSKDAKAEEAERRIREHCVELRNRYEWDSAGLYSAPPAASPRRIPDLLAASSRDGAPQAHQRAPEGGLGDETTGHAVTHPQDVTGDVTGFRDRFRLIPGQAGHEAADCPDAPLDPAPEAPKLLSIAEGSRELQARGFKVEANTMRQHKRRRESTGFPTGVLIDGSEKFTLAQLLYFYEKRGYERQEGDAKEGAV
ncbi:hypothetical protein [Streptomyces sp. NPDC087300]|uniref:hypothetical protein n=1 Tax=Streptomyces sp. NPDC087300 TaxID=3365780 RepID=UPI00380DA030